MVAETVEINGIEYVLVERGRNLPVVSSGNKAEHGEVRKGSGTQAQQDIIKTQVIYSDLSEGVGLDRIPSDWPSYPRAPRRSWDATADTRWGSGNYLPLLQQDSAETNLEVIRASAAFKSNLWALWEDNTGLDVLARKYDADGSPPWQAGGDASQKPTVDATSSGSVFSDTTLTISHTVSATLPNMCLVVGVVAFGEPTGVTYDGVAMTKLIETDFGAENTSIWYQAGPSTGANNIVISAGSGRILGGGVSFSGVNQATPMSNSTSESGTGTSASLAVTTVNNSIAVNVVSHTGGGAHAVGSGQTEYFDVAVASGSGAGSYERATGTSTTMSFSWTSSSAFSHSAGRVNGVLQVPLDLQPHKTSLLGLIAAGDSHRIVASTDGATWAETAQQPTNNLLANTVTVNENIDAGLLAEIGGESVAVVWDEDSGTITFFSSTDIWVSNVRDEAVDISSGNGPQGVAVMKGTDGEDKLYVMAREGLWEVDTAPSTWTTRQVDSLPPHNDNGRRMAIHQRDLWYGVGVGDNEAAPVRIYSTRDGEDRVITRDANDKLIGLDADQGVPSDRFGPIRRLVSAGGELFASVGGGAANRNGSVYAHNGAGWHSVMKHGTADKEVQWIAVSPDDDGTQRLHWAVRTAGSTSDTRFVENPLSDPASGISIKRERSGYIYLPFSNNGMPTYDAAWLQARVEADDVSGTASNEYINLDYGVSGTLRESFTDLGNILSGTKVLDFASKAGVSSPAMAINIVLHNDASDNTDTPIFRSLEHVLTKFVTRLEFWEFRVDIRGLMPGGILKSPKSNYDSFMAAVDLTTLPSFKWANQATKYVRITDYAFHEDAYEEGGNRVDGAANQYKIRQGYMDVRVEEMA